MVVMVIRFSVDLYEMCYAITVVRSLLSQTCVFHHNFPLIELTFRLFNINKQIGHMIYCTVALKHCFDRNSISSLYCGLYVAL